MKKSKLITITTTAVILGSAVMAFNFKSNLPSASATETTNIAQSQNTEYVLSPKEEIQDKMYNSIDNYSKVQGSFVYSSQAIGDEFVIDYKIKTKNGAYSYVKVNAKQSNFETEYDQSVKEGTSVDHKEKLVFVSPAVDVPTTDGNKLKTKDKTYKNDKGESVFERREDPTYMGGLAATSLFPQDIAASFLEDYNSWDITSENEMINGLEAVLIEGKLNEYFHTKHNATTFKLWVHKETGILLQMEEIDDKGNVTESLKTLDLKLNDKVTDEKVKINIPSEYKKK